MGVGDKNALLRDGTVALTATEVGAPSTAGTFVFDTATSAAVPTGGVVFQTATTGPGTGLDHPLVAAMIVPSGTLTNTSISVKIQATDDTTLATYEDVVWFGLQQAAGGYVGTQAAVTANVIPSSAITPNGAEFRMMFVTRRRFIRHNVVTYVGGGSSLGVIIRIEGAL